jgi:hypothetical protein
MGCLRIHEASDRIDKLLVATRDVYNSIAAD